jgi:hypothetical protein
VVHVCERGVAVDERHLVNGDHQGLVHEVKNHRDAREFRGEHEERVEGEILQARFRAAFY